MQRSAAADLRAAHAADRAEQLRAPQLAPSHAPEAGGSPREVAARAGELLERSNSLVRSRSSSAPRLRSTTSDAFWAAPMDPLPRKLLPEPAAQRSCSPPVEVEPVVPQLTITIPLSQ